MNLPTKVFFLHVKDNPSKIQRICQQVHESYNKGKKVLVTVQSEEAAKYIDALLWRHPEESFIPHNIIKAPSQERIGITISNTVNYNQAQCLLNLSPVISPIYSQFEEIYELYDETHPEKIQMSEHKIKEYEAKGLRVMRLLERLG